jgi:hypothetical protein
MDAAEAEVRQDRAECLAGLRLLAELDGQRQLTAAAFDVAFSTAEAEAFACPTTPSRLPQALPLHGRRPPSAGR